MRGPWTPSTRSSSMSEVALGPETSVIGRPSRAASASGCDGVGHAGHDRACLDDAHVPVGHERERPAAGALAAVEHDRAGLGDRQSGAGEHAVELIERLRGERRVVDHDLDAGPQVGPARRHRDPLRAALAAQPRDGLGQVGGGHARDRRPVLGHALAEAVDDLGRPRLAGRAGAAIRTGHLGCDDARAERAADPAEHASRAALTSPLRAVAPPLAERLLRRLGQIAHRRPPRERRLRDRPAAEPRELLRALEPLARGEHGRDRPHRQRLRAQPRPLLADHPPAQVHQ